MKHVILWTSFVIFVFCVSYVLDKFEMKKVLEESLVYDIVFFGMGAWIACRTGWDILKRILN